MEPAYPSTSEQACTQVAAGGQGESGWSRQVLLFPYRQTCYPDPMERELAILTSAIRHAGERAMDLAKKGFEVQTKRDRSPVTSADLEVNRILHDMQNTHFPDDGWLSEESPVYTLRLDKARVWIVDPIDGTKAYVNKLPEYCISVGLVEAGMPVLGAIFNPSTDELFTAILGQGLRLNGQPVAPAASVIDRSDVLVNLWEYHAGRWADLNGRIHCRPM